MPIDVGFVAAVVEASDIYLCDLQLTSTERNTIGSLL